VPPQPAALPRVQVLDPALPPPPQPTARIATRSMQALVRRVFKVSPVKEAASSFPAYLFAASNSLIGSNKQRDPAATRARNAEPARAAIW
jgi:hypothetical protein